MTRSLQLMVLMGKVVPAPAPPALIDALQSVQVTSSSGSASGFQLTFAVGQQSPVTQVMLPAGLLDPKTRVIVVAVVAGLPHVLMDGVIARQEMNPGQTPGSSTLTLTGEDLTLLMDLGHVERGHPGLPHHLRAMSVCAQYAQYGIVPVAVPPVISAVPNPAVQIPIQSATDLAYLRSLAAEVGYVFFIEPGPVPGASIAYWGPEVRVGQPQPALTVDSGTAGNVESLSFGFDGMSHAHYTARFVEPLTKATVAVPDIGLLHSPLAQTATPALREEPLTGQTGRSIVEAQLWGLSRTSESADAITGHGRLDVLRYGHVLSPRNLVGVRGAGRNYDGVYYVRSVTHDIARGGYKQSFTLIRDGLVSKASVVIP
ncbi:hypothetical protein ACFWN5_36880 [Streptomyces sp. NPDC058430]|uniref:hypothetical protein n=1 Tax=Streptomyces sp. NPDC058430 TaxID=3346495 RepID=UPI00364F891C